MDPQLLEQFLEDVLLFEEIPTTTFRKRLAAAGTPPPGDLRGLLELLADMNVVVAQTNHLDDAELYARLQATLDEPMQFPANPDTVMYLKAADDEETYLRYYATDEERAEWGRDFPASPLPPRQTPSYDRDRTMPLPRRERSRRAAGSRS
jgi:hypothetical protein